MKLGLIILIVIGIVFLITITTLAVLASNRTPIYDTTPSKLQIFNLPVNAIFEKIGKETPFKLKIDNLPTNMLERFMKLKFKDFSLDNTYLQENTMRLLKKKSHKEVAAMNAKVLAQTRLTNDRESSVFYADTAMLEELLGKTKLAELKELLAPFKKFFQIKIWLNTPGYTTPLHSDSVRNFVMQLYGRKRWVLISKRHWNDCYPGRINEFKNQFFKTKNPYNVDIKQFPKFKNVKILSVDMQPGELLYVPFKYLHFVHSLDTSIMVSFIYE